MLWVLHCFGGVKWPFGYPDWAMVFVHECLISACVKSSPSICDYVFALAVAGFIIIIIIIIITLILSY